MRGKRENIYQFIMDLQRENNRERTFTEKILREDVLASTGGPKTCSEDSCAACKELCKRETVSPSRGNRRAKASSRQEVDRGAIEHVEIADSTTGSLKPRTSGFRKGLNPEIAVIPTTTVIVCSLISTAALLRLDTIVHQDLYSHGLQFSFDWATPYWTDLRMVLGMLWLMILAAVVFQIHLLRYKTRESADDSWKTYALKDGTTIRVKTVLKSIKRLEEYGHDGKPVYSIEADNLIEVLNVPKSH